MDYDLSLTPDERAANGVYYTPRFIARDLYVNAYELLRDLIPEAVDRARAAITWTAWDCAAGTGHLTAPGNFDNLYLSTLDNAEVDLAAEVPGSTAVFQYDFLNDDPHLFQENSPATSEKLPPQLLQALKDNDPIIFYINPPYRDVRRIPGYSSAARVYAKPRTKGVATNLYSLFIYRIAHLAKRFGYTENLVIVGLTPWWLSTMPGLYNELRNNFDFYGFDVFNAKHFPAVKGEFPLTTWAAVMHPGAKGLLRRDFTIREYHSDGTRYRNGELLPSGRIYRTQSTAGNGHLRWEQAA